jgi:hypothetical protein
MTLRVYNYANVPPSLLTRSEQEAKLIFHQAGVEVAWVDCPLSPGEFDRFSACRQPMTHAEFVRRILSLAMTLKAPAHSEALGFALPCVEERSGCTASVFYPRMFGTRNGEVSAYQILGHAMAHEIGHLLLGPNSHSRDGIMRGDWSPDDLLLIGRASLHFTPQQSALIRAAVRARTLLPEAEVRQSASQTLRK